MEQAEDSLTKSYIGGGSEGRNAPDNIHPSKGVRFTFNSSPRFTSLIISLELALRLTEHECTPSIKWQLTPLPQGLEFTGIEVQDITNVSLSHQMLAIGNDENFFSAFEVGISIGLNQPSR